MERVGAAPRHLVLLELGGHVCLLRSGLIHLCEFSLLALWAVWVSGAGPHSHWEALHGSE